AFLERQRCGETFGVHKRPVRRAQILHHGLAVDERDARVPPRDLTVGKRERLFRVPPDGDGLGADFDALSLRGPSDRYEVMPNNFGRRGRVEWPPGADENRALWFVVLVWCHGSRVRGWAQHTRPQWACATGRAGHLATLRAA